MIIAKRFGAAVIAGCAVDVVAGNNAKHTARRNAETLCSDGFVVLRSGWLRPLIQVATASTWRQVQAIASRDIPARLPGYNALQPATWPDASSMWGKKRAAVTIPDEPSFRGFGALVASRWNNSLEHQQQMTTIAALDPTFSSVHFGERSHRYVRLAHGGLLWYLLPWLGAPTDRTSMEIRGNSWAWCLPALVSRELSAPVNASGFAPPSLPTRRRIGSAHIDAGDDWKLSKWGVSLPPRPADAESGPVVASHPWSLLLTEQLTVLYTVMNPVPCDERHGVTAFWPGSHVKVSNAIDEAAGISSTTTGTGTGTGTDATDDDNDEYVAVDSKVVIRENAERGGDDTASSLDWRDRLYPLMAAIRASCDDSTAVQRTLYPGDAVLALGWTVHAAVTAQKAMPFQLHGPEPEWVARLLARWEGDTVNAMIASLPAQSPEKDTIGCARFLQNARATARLCTPSGDPTRSDASQDEIADIIAQLLPQDAPIRRALCIPNRVQ